MTNRMMVTLILAILLSPWAGSARSENSPMPPAFTSGAASEQTLRAYPLGVITKQAAFSHHGKAHREIKLPNGLEGWVYDVGGLQRTVPYSGATGEKKTVQETEIAHKARTYTLVFDDRGVVIDVLYNENGRHDGLTALSLQYTKGVARTEEHAHPAGK